MKKLLLILLPVTLFLVSCGGGGSDDLQPIDPPTLSLEETLVGKKWCLSNQDENGFKLSENGEFMITQKCTPHIALGNWIIEDSLIKYSYIDNSIQTTVLWGEITEYSTNQVKILINNSPSTISEAIYSLTSEDVYGCMDISSSNYNPLANCNDDFSCIDFYTYVPDFNFEQELINLGYDDILNNYVETSNISSITSIELNFKNISDLTGIEDFSALTILECKGNQLTSLDVSQNTALTELRCSSNYELTSLNVSGAIALAELICMGNQLTNLDVSNSFYLTHLVIVSNQLTTLDLNNNTALIVLECGGNQLTTLDVGNNINLEYLDCHTNQLSSLNVRNGNNSNFILQNWSNGSNGFISYGNTLLGCIEVDDAAWSTSNWTYIDPQHYFSEDCP